MTDGSGHLEAKRRQPEHLDPVRTERAGVLQALWELVEQPGRIERHRVAVVAGPEVDRRHQTPPQPTTTGNDSKPLTVEVGAMRTLS